MRILFRILMTIVAALVAAAILIPLFFDLNHYKPQIEKTAFEALGRELKIAGPIKAGIFPSPHVSMEDVHLANDSRSKQDMLNVKMISVDVALMPLFKKQVDITSIELVSPVINAEEYSATENNWQSVVTKLTAPSDSKTEIKIDKIKINNAEINYKKPRQAQTYKDIDLLVQGDIMREPIKAELSLLFNNQKLEVTLKTDKLNLKAPVTFDASIGYAGHKLNTSGTLDIDHLAYKGKVNGELAKLSDAINNIKFDANVVADANTVALSNLQFKTDKLNGSGSLKYRIKTKSVKTDLKGLPGNTHIILDTSLDKPGRYDGSINLHSDDLLTLLNTIKIDAPSMVKALAGNIVLNTDFAFNGFNDVAVKGMELKLNDAQLNGDIAKKGGLISLNIRAPKTSPWTKIFDIKMNELDSVQVMGTLSGDAKKMDIDLQTQIGDGSIKAKGQLNEITNNLTYNVDAKVVNNDLNRLLVRLGGSALPIGAHNFQFSGHLKGDAHNIKIDNMRGSITPKSSAVSFSGDANVGLGAKKDIKLNLALGDINLQEMFAQSNRMVFKLAAKRFNMGSNHKGWSQEPLKLSALNDLKLDGRITANSLLFKGYRLSNVTIPLTIKNGDLNAPITAKMAGGGFDCNVKLNSSNNVGIDLALDNANLDSLLTKKDAVYGGQVSIKLKVNGNGQSQHQIVNSLTGTFSLNTTNTRIKGLDMAETVGGLGNVRNVEGVVGLFMQQAVKRGTPSAAIAINADIANGIATIKQGSLTAEGVNGVITGTVDLPAYNVDAHAVVHLKGLERAPVEVDMGGPLDNVQTNIDKSKVISALAQGKEDDGQGNILGKVLGGKNSSGGGSKKEQAVEAITDILGGFLKK